MANKRGTFWGKVADVFIPGNAYNSQTGRWNPTQVKVGLTALAAGLLVPGGSMIVNQGANRGFFGNALKNLLSGEQKNSSQTTNNFNNIPNGNTPNAPWIIQKQPITADTHLDVPNASFTGRMNISMPVVGTNSAVSAPTVLPDLGTGSGGVFHGGSLGSWAQSGAAATGHTAMTSGQIAGASVISGDAARAMFEGMTSGRDASLSQYGPTGKRYRE